MRAVPLGAAAAEQIFDLRMRGGKSFPLPSNHTKFQNARKGGLWWFYVLLYLFNRPFSVYFFTRSSWPIVQETIAKNSAFFLSAGWRRSRRPQPSKFSKETCDCAGWTRPTKRSLAIGVLFRRSFPIRFLVYGEDTLITDVSKS